ncbi:PASTA domain-containing protein [Catellatospora coxensis]
MAVLSLVGLAAFVLSRPGEPESPPQGSAASPSVTASGSVVAATTAAPTPVAGATPTHRASPAAPAGTEPSDAPAVSPEPAAETANPAGSPSPQSTSRTVPGMFSWREVEVREAMDRLGLVVNIEYRSTLDQCHVLEQTPAGGTVVAAGSTVDVVIGKPTGVCKVT